MGTMALVAVKAGMKFVTGFISSLVMNAYHSFSMGQFQGENVYNIFKSALQAGLQAAVMSLASDMKAYMMAEFGASEISFEAYLAKQFNMQTQIDMQNGWLKLQDANKRNAEVSRCALTIFILNGHSRVS